MLGGALRVENLDVVVRVALGMVFLHPTQDGVFFPIFRTASKDKIRFSTSEDSFPLYTLFGFLEIFPPLSK